MRFNVDHLISGLWLFFLSSQISFAAAKEFSASYRLPLAQSSLIAAIDFRQQDEHLFRRHFDIGIRSPLPFLDESWSFGAHYRHVYTPSNKGGWNLEKRPYIQLQKKTSSAELLFIPALKWSIRNRQEFRFRQQKDNAKRYRLKVSAKTQQVFFYGQPFIAGEAYYDFLSDQLTKTSLEIGFKFSKFYQLKPSLSYKQTATYKNKGWQPYSAIVLKLAF